MAVLREDRFHELRDDDPRESRRPARRDRDRILYSSAFRRLSGITQVVAPNERYPIHNRLTHTVKVAQIGRSLAENLLGSDRHTALLEKVGGIDPDVVETAALAHDLGHPPFGHVAEKALDELVLAALGKGSNGDDTDGFEGNAQSFRIVTRLAVRYPDVDGMNLTRATLCALLKYPWLRGNEGKKKIKWGAYRSEASELAWARALMPTGSDKKSLEADLMDWADDVTYAVHDLEDFFRAGLIPFDRLANDRAEQDRFLADLIRRERTRDSPRFREDELARAFHGLVGPAPTSSPFRGTHFDRAALQRFTSALIARYVNSVELAPDAECGAVLQIDRNSELEVTILQSLTRYYVIESRSLVTQRFGQSNLIRALFKIFLDAMRTPQDWHIFPAIYRETLETATSDEERIRVVADLISSMSETQVVEVHHRLTGLSLGSAMDPVLP